MQRRDSRQKIRAFVAAAVVAALTVPAQPALAQEVGCNIPGLGFVTATNNLGRNVVTGSGTIRGTEGPDLILGSSGDDTIFGGPGNDIIKAAAATTRSSAAPATTSSRPARATTPTTATPRPC
jgi:hypothetical protein